MILDDPSTINQWLQRPGPIHLRHERKREPHHDLRAFHGILTWTAATAAVLAWAFVMWRLW